MRTDELRAVATRVMELRQELESVEAVALAIFIPVLTWVLYGLQHKPVGAGTSTEESLSDIVPGPGTMTWRKFTPETLAALRADGKAVFIDFTADWCITCKVNERVALSKPEVSAAFAEKGIVALKADWTNSDEMVTTALEGYGRNSIPLYVYYPAGGGDYKLLPQVLTPGIVVNAL
jgi:thiol:disulfide interchange protein DsbD